MKKIGFNNQKYLEMQSEHIKERISQFGDKLYLEFGGKLFDDNHASRVLPGFSPDSKLQMLMQLKDDAEIVIVINANDIEQNKTRSDLQITYQEDVLRLINEFTQRGLYVGSVVVTQYNRQKAVDLFKARLKRRKIDVYFHYFIEGYPTDTKKIISDSGFGKNDYVHIYCSRHPGSKQWDNLCDVIGRPDLKQDVCPEMATPRSRYEHRDICDGAIKDWLKDYDKFTAMDILCKADIPAGALLSVDDITKDQQYYERGMMVEIDHPQRGWGKLPVFAPIMCAVKVEYLCCPLLGSSMKRYTAAC